jgi:hypothetical protein
MELPVKLGHDHFHILSDLFFTNNLPFDTKQLQTASLYNIHGFTAVNRKVTAFF